MNQDISEILDILPGYFRIILPELRWQFANGLTNNLKFPDHRGKCLAVMTKLLKRHPLYVSQYGAARILDIFKVKQEISFRYTQSAFAAIPLQLVSGYAQTQRRRAAAMFFPDHA